MAYGQFMFFLVPRSRCVLNVSPFLPVTPELARMDHFFLYCMMCTLCALGLLFQCQTVLMACRFVNKHYHYFINYNHRIIVLRTIDRHYWKQGDQKECIICFKEFDGWQDVCNLDCHKEYIYHPTCLKEWIKKGSKSCPICRKSIFEQGRTFTVSEAIIQLSLHVVDIVYEYILETVKSIISAYDALY